jgi:hypothetical protein
MSDNVPTPLAPWYVVVLDGYYAPGDLDVYDLGDWTSSPKKAMLFHQLQLAVSVAKAEGAEIQVIWNAEKLKEFQK